MREAMSETTQSTASTSPAPVTAETALMFQCLPSCAASSPSACRHTTQRAALESKHISRHRKA